jgi:hypothetical protein
VPQITYCISIYCRATCLCNTSAIPRPEDDPVKVETGCLTIYTNTIGYL